MGRVDNSAALPRLRADLIFSRHGDGEAVIVKDPVSSEFFRLGRAEWFIAQQLDGSTDLDEVRRRAQTQFGASLPDGMLEHFVADLEHRGLLERPGRSISSRRGRRIRGSWLHLRILLLDPTALLDRLQRRTRWCFTRGFLIASATIIVLAAATLASNWAAFSADLPGLLQPASLPVVGLMLFLLVALHEFGHGLTCRHFGGEVREMGVLFMYFAPALYCNVSDAWLFTDKRKRMWVGFAGPYFELLVWALAVLAWRVTDPATGINYLALIVVAGSGLKTLFNFNPLIKLDGYYLLSDYLDLPNLRAKSFRYVGDALKLITGWGDGPAPAVPRERRIYLTYGVLATIYSFSLLGFMTLHWGDFLIAHGQPIALALVTGLVGIRVRRRVHGILGVGTNDNDDEAEPESKPPKEHRSRRRAKTGNLRRRQAWIAGAVVILAAMFVVPVHLRISGPITVLPAAISDVRAAVEGIVDSVLVTEGQTIQMGDAIARLSAAPLQTELQATRADLAETEAGLSKLRAGPTAAEIELARAAVARAEDRVGFASTRLARIVQLHEQGAATRPELEDAREQATTADNDLVEARSRLNVLKASVRPEEIQAMRARVARLQSRQQFLEQQLELLTVQSPVDGVVATPQRQLQALAGQLVTKGALIASIYDFRTVTAHIAIPEKEMADIGVGQEVALRARAYPSVTFSGTVTAIATAAQGTAAGATAATAAAGPPGSGTTFIVTTRVHNDLLLLKPGMTGQAKVYAGRRSVVSIIARRVARMLKVEVWSWW